MNQSNQPAHSQPAFDAPILPSLDLELSSNFSFKTLETAQGTFLSVAAESLDAVYLDGKPDWSQTNKIQLIHVDALIPHPWNPRKTTSRESLVTLAESLRAGGLHSPLDICQKDSDSPELALILSGHRRLWTTKGVGADLIPCKLDPRGVLTEVEQREALIRYNEGQEKPAPINRAQSILDLMVTSKLTQAQTATRLGINPATVSRLLKLLTLPEIVQNMTNKGELNESVAYELTRIQDNPQRQIDLALEAKERGYSAAKVKRMACRPKIKLESRSSAAKRPTCVSERTIEVPDGSATIKISSARVVITDTTINEALQQVIYRIPVELQMPEPVSADNSSANTTASPDGSQSTEPNSLRQPDKIQTVPDKSKSGDMESSLPAEEDRLGLKQPTEYQFSRIDGHISGAAASINAIFTNGYPDWSRTDEIQLVFRTALAPHPWNPRKHISIEAMRDTVLSVKESGIHTPLKITQHPESEQKAYILGGHRRTWVAAKLGLELLPVKLDPRGILNEVAVRETLINDNEGQLKPAPIERAESLSDYLAASQLAISEAARRLNISEPDFSKSLRLLELPKEVQMLINNGDLAPSAGITLLDHRGGEQAIIGLAYKVLTHNIPLATLTKMVRRSQVDLGGLAADTPRRSSEQHNVVGGNNRIHVVLKSNQGELPAGEELATLLETVQQNFDAPGTGASPVTTSVQTHTLQLKECIRYSEASAKYWEHFLPDHVTRQNDGLYISKDTADLLALKFNNDELKKLGFTTQEITAFHTRRLLNIQSRLSNDDRVSVGHVTEYLIKCYDCLHKLPATKQQLSAIEIAQLELDTQHFNGASVDILKQELKERLKALPEIFTVRLSPLVELQKIAKSVQQVTDADMAFTRDELSSAGIPLANNFESQYKRWLADTKRIPYTGSIEDRGLRFDDLHAYFTHCARYLLETTGGRAERSIGIKQLRAGHIVFSKVGEPSKTRRFNSHEVFQEVRDSLEKLNNLFASKTANRP